MQAPKVSIAGENVVLRGIMATPRRTSRVYAAQRICSAGGCATVLSRYNASSFCWQHEPSHPFVLRIERKDKRRG